MQKVGRKYAYIAEWEDSRYLLSPFRLQDGRSLDTKGGDRSQGQGFDAYPSLRAYRDHLRMTVDERKLSAILRAVHRQTVTLPPACVAELLQVLSRHGISDDDSVR